MLALPRIDPDIPLRLVPVAARQRGAHLARVLIQAGLIDARTLPARMDADHIATCRAALTAWLNQRLCGLRCLRPMFSLGLHEAAGSEFAGEHDGYRLRGQIAWYGGGGTWCVGPALECLEAFHARLGMTVLRIIEDRSWRTLPLFTPGTALDVARDFYWYGEEDEETALQESWGDDADAREAMRAGMVTRTLFDATYPKWALPGASQRRPLRTRQIAEAAEQAIGSAGPRIQGVIQDAGALMRLRVPARAPQAQDQEGYFIGFAGVLTWREDDPVTPRVVDDFEQMVGESGEFFEESGTCEVDLCGPEALLRWVKDMEPWFAAVRLIDSLIFRLSDGDWSEHTKVAKDSP